MSSTFSPDTIAAISTAPGEAGIAIIRISGPDALRIADAVALGRRRPSASPPRTALLTRVGSSGAAATPAAAIDEAIVLTFRAPHSYTGEDVVEIQGHGGRAVVNAILRAVLEHGARLAEPGEFTRRAFLNGRIDLLQAEAVGDLIRAQSERAARVASEQLVGSLSIVTETVYSGIVAVAADLETTLDFAEDELPPTAMDSIQSRLVAILANLEALIETWQEGHLLREGALVVISGEPNAGKSTLMNRLLRKDRSIVTEHPGTTRDTIEESFTCGGILVRLVDTAGLREAAGEVEREGIRRAHEAIRSADLNLHVLDGSRPLQPGDRATLSGFRPGSCLVLLNKSDLGAQLREQDLPDTIQSIRVHLTSDEPLTAIVGSISRLLGASESAPPHAAISERHRSILEAVRQEVDQALTVLRDPAVDGGLLAAQNLRSALDALGAMTGREYSTELLDSIFSRYCIGK